MLNGRTIVEVLVSQAVILLAFLYAPFDLVDVFGGAGAVVLTMVLAAAITGVLYTRHWGRSKRRFARKVEALRRLPIS